MRGETRAAVTGLAVLLAGLLGCADRTPANLEARDTPAVPVTVASARAIPRLVDVGADKCIPCKAMAPILAQLRTDYSGRLDVVFVDVWKYPDLAGSYSVRTIPTQIFFGADGRELARHTGFMSREEILAQWKSLGVEL